MKTKARLQDSLELSGNSFWVSLKKNGLHQNEAHLFQCKSCLFAEVSNRSHAGKAGFKLNTTIEKSNGTYMPILKS